MIIFLKSSCLNLVCNMCMSHRKDASLKIILERAVDGVPSLIPTLKILTLPAPWSPTPGHDLGNRVKILFILLSIFYLCEHTQSLV